MGSKMIEHTLINDFITKAMSTKKTINVIGDCLLDESYEVEKRYNPESTAPAFNITKKLQSLPGGAGNVIYQYQNMPLKSRLYGAIDSRSKQVYQEHNIKTNNTIKCHSTPIKARYYQDNKILQRIDDEIIKDHNFTGNLKNSDINVFSDYDKGFLVKPWFKDFLRNSIVDPKPTSSIYKWHGCHAIKLNSDEAYSITNSRHSPSQLDIINKLTGCKNIVITMSGNGVVGLDEGEYFYIEQPGVIVRNVVGAGDCFLAYFSYAKALGFSTKESCNIAILASTIYVSNETRKPLNLIDLITNKIVPCASLLKDRNYNLVFTNGCFDVLHAGHVECLKFAKSKGDRLVVALNSDNSIKRLKGMDRPINNLQNRLSVLASLEMVDYIIHFDEDTPLNVINQIKPNSIVKGSSYSKNDVVGNNLVDEVFICPMVEGLSSTNIINKI